MRKFLAALFVIFSAVVCSADSIYTPPPSLPLSAANGGTGEAGTITGALKGNGTSAATQAACADLSNGATGCLTAITTGTFTPVLAFGGASVGITYAAQSGKYVQTGTGSGSQICLTGYISISSKGSSTGVATITGLPSGAPVSGLAGLVPINTGGFTLTGTLNLYVNSSAALRVYQETTGTFADLTNTNFSNIADIGFSGCYIVA